MAGENSTKGLIEDRVTGETELSDEVGELLNSIASRDRRIVEFRSRDPLAAEVKEVMNKIQSGEDVPTSKLEELSKKLLSRDDLLAEVAMQSSEIGELVNKVKCWKLNFPETIAKEEAPSILNANMNKIERINNRLIESTALMRPSHEVGEIMKKVKGTIRSIVLSCENSLKVIEAARDRLGPEHANTLDRYYLDLFSGMKETERLLVLFFGDQRVTETGETSEKASVGIAVTEEVKKEGEVTVETSEKASAVTEEVKKEGEVTVETSDKASVVTEEAKKEGEVTVETSDKASVVTEEAKKEGEVTGGTSEKASAGIAMTEKVEKEGE